MNLITSFEEYHGTTIPKYKIVCPRCDGEGAHVNPAIDGNGITQEEWSDWDDDEREGYLTGRYDVTCEECGGRNVIDEVDEEAMDPALLSEWNEWVDSDRETKAIYRMERMMGA